jgi:hypothetical protein
VERLERVTGSSTPVGCTSLSVRMCSAIEHRGCAPTPWLSEPWRSQVRGCGRRHVRSCVRRCHCARCNVCVAGVHPQWLGWRIQRREAWVTTGVPTHTHSQLTTIRASLGSQPPCLPPPPPPPPPVRCCSCCSPWAPGLRVTRPSSLSGLIGGRSSSGTSPALMATRCIVSAHVALLVNVLRVRRGGSACLCWCCMRAHES